MHDGRILEQLFALAVLLGQAMERGLSARGLTRARARLLWRLVHDGPATHRGLADALGVTPRNVTGLVDALEADGFVVRQPHPTDRRAAIVALTDRGARTTAAMQRDADALAARLTGHLEQDQREALSTRLVEIVGALAAEVADLDGGAGVPDRAGGADGGDLG